MSPGLTNFLFETVNFLLLAGMLGWLLFKPARRALEAERERHANEEQDIQRLRDEAQALVEEARAARKALEGELDVRRREVLLAAENEAASMRQAAADARATERQRLEQELASRLDAQTAELTAVMGRIAAESVRQLLETLAGPALDLALVRAAGSELDLVPSDARKTAVVESARPLGEEARRILQRSLGAEVKERIVGELGAGVRVTTTSGQVDATAMSFARCAERAVKGIHGSAPAR